MPLLAPGVVPRVRLVPLGDREFRAEPGDVYYVKAGPRFAAETGTELVESTPANEQARVMAALSQVLSDERETPRRTVGLPPALGLPGTGSAGRPGLRRGDRRGWLAAVHDLQHLVRQWDQGAWRLAALALALGDEGPLRDPAREVVRVLGLVDQHGDIELPEGATAAGLAGQAAAPLLQAARLLTAGASWAEQSDEALIAQGQASGQFGPIFRNSLLDHFPGLAERLAEPGARMLDVGVGVGFLAAGFLDVFPALTVVGIDVLPRVLRLAEAVTRPYGERVELREQDVSSLDDVQAYDLAWAPGPFVPPDPLALGIPRIARALRPGGWLVLGHGKFAGDPVEDALVRLRTAAYGGTPLDDRQAQELLRRAGLDDVRTLRTPTTAPALTIGRAPLQGA